eukprot:s1_g1859.t1
MLGKIFGSYRMTEQSQVTLAEGTIHNPGEPRHFMRIRQLEREVTIRRGDETLAKSSRCRRLMEVGRDFYEPVLYLPREDVIARMTVSETTTSCVLKGTASYLSLLGDSGDVAVPDIAWVYDVTHDFASEIKGLVAFYPHLVTIEETPIGKSAVSAA